MRVWFLAGGIAAAVAAVTAMCGSTPGIANSIGTGVVPGTSVSSPAQAATPAAAPAARLNTGKLAAFVYKASPEPVAEFPFFDAEKQTQTIASHRRRQPTADVSQVSFLCLTFQLVIFKCASGL